MEGKPAVVQFCNTLGIGERTFHRAKNWVYHKIAKIKTIPAIIKEYKSDGQFMVESLIENIHREDLTPTEKGKFIQKIMKEFKTNSSSKIAEILNIRESDIRFWKDVIDIKSSSKIAAAAKISDSTIVETKGLPKKEQEILIKQAAKEDFGKMEMRRRVKEIKTEPTPEPVVYERTADDVFYEINLKYHDINELLREVPNLNLKDLQKETAKFIKKIWIAMGKPNLVSMGSPKSPERPNNPDLKLLSQTLKLSRSTLAEHFSLVDISTPKEVKKAVEEGKPAVVQFCNTLGIGERTFHKAKNWVYADD